MLRSLELFGFKSFAERTAFDFAAGITCVVGPNGSGKSNVVDAIKWLLGDQSPKSLRGSEMTDVIFNGSKQAKPSGYAEAILTFDNGQGTLAIDTPEVRIGRRLYRSGDSEYLLNGNVVRLKDIRDLTAGTGIGLSAYNIIEQGRVGQILQGNSTSRRTIFEEAAGVSRFKARKLDALRKLERVAQNLARLRDLVDEVDTQLQSMRSQAAKAAKYREVSEELRVAWLGLATDDFRHLTGKVTQIDGELGGLRERHARCTQQVAEMSSRRQASEVTVQQADAEVSAVQQQLTAVREQLAQRTTLQRAEQDRLTERLEDRARLVQQLAAVRSRVQALRTEIDQSQARFDELAAQAAVKQTDREALQTARRDISQQNALLESQLQDLARKLHDLDAEETAKRTEGTSLANRTETIHASLERTQSQLREAASELQRAEAELRTREAIAADAARRKGHWTAEAELLKKEHDRLIRQREQLTRDIAAAREQRSAEIARREILEEFEQRQEGLAIGPREILERARRSRAAPWNSVLGAVSDLMELRLEYAPIVELALGERAQWIVVDRLDPIIAYLQQETVPFTERVGFIDVQGRSLRPAGEVHTNPFGSFDLSTDGRVLTRVDKLIDSFRVADRTFAERLLGDCWLVHDLAAARDLVAASGGRVRCITLQGELIEPEGCLVVGTPQREASVVSRRSELRELKRSAEALELQVNEWTADAQRLTAEISVAERGWLQSQQTLQTEANSLSELNGAVTVQLGLVEHWQEEARRLQSDADQLEARRQQFAQAIAQTERWFGQFGTQRDAVVTQQEDLLKTRDELVRQLAGVRRREAELEVDQARTRERLDGQELARQRLATELQERVELEAEMAARLEQTDERVRETELHLLNLRAEVDELLVQDEQIAVTRDALRTEQIAARELRQTLLAEEEEVRLQQRAVDDRLRQAEFDHHQATVTLDGLRQRILEEYQLTLDEVAALQISAFENYCARHHRAPLAAAIGPAGETDEADSADPGSGESTRGATGTAFGEPLALPRFEDVREELEAEVSRLRRRLKSLGSVNTDSLEALDELEQRAGHLQAQYQDLSAAKETLEEIVARLDQEMIRLFRETFDTVRGHFQLLFRKLFGGGEGDLILEDPEDPLECGIEIVARPPGKELRSIGLMSGGEKTMTAVGLLLALFRSRPSPFCILDEVDAALDEANIDRYITTLGEFKQQTQFIMITHRKRTMTVADRIYGVTMETAGISKRLSVHLDQLDEHGNVVDRSHAA